MCPPPWPLSPCEFVGRKPESMATSGRASDCRFPAVNSGEARQDEVDLADVHRRWFQAMHSGDLAAAWLQTDRIEALRRRRGWREEARGEMLWDGSPFKGRR